VVLQRLVFFSIVPKIYLQTKRNLKKCEGKINLRSRGLGFWGRLCIRSPLFWSSTIFSGQSAAS